MPKDEQLRECIVCGEEADAAAMRGKICFSCRTAAALKTAVATLPDLIAEVATVVSGGGRRAIA